MIRHLQQNTRQNRPDRRRGRCGHQRSLSEGVCELWCARYMLLRLNRARFSARQRGGCVVVTSHGVIQKEWLRSASHDVVRMRECR